VVGDNPPSVEAIGIGRGEEEDQRRHDHIRNDLVSGQVEILAQARRSSAAGEKDIGGDAGAFEVLGHHGGLCLKPPWMRLERKAQHGVEAGRVGDDAPPPTVDHRQHEPVSQHHRRYCVDCEIAKKHAIVARSDRQKRYGFSS
jgi:hypothetical protein